MNAILIKIFAVALTLSQVTTRSDIKTEFDPTRDRAEVAQLLRDGCAHMLKAFDVENINIDELIAVAMNDPQAVEGESKVFRGINLDDLVAAYRQFCKAEAVDAPIVDVGDIIAFYNKATADLPDATRLKEQKLRGLNVIFDGKGKRFADDYQPGQRRLSVPLSDVPEVVQQAFVAVEDKRFFAHHGVDERGLIRAFVGNLAQPGRPQGGSTITQQVVKNLLVGDDVTYERKIREMIVASRMEHQLSKSEILELYLNSIYLGRSAWGIEMASRRYFGKSAKELSLAEGALLAGLTKGPSYFSPDRYPDRAEARFEYVLTRMQQDGVIDADQMQHTAASEPRMVALERPGRDSGLYFVDQIRREAKTAADVDLLTGGSYTVRSTINPALQRAVETALQDGLARYEISRGRVEFQGAETNLANTVRRIQVSEQKFPSAQAAWQRALATAHLMLYAVDKDPAVSLKRVCDIALEAKVYTECIPYYPFVLGAQPVRPIDLAGFYATVANEGARPTPYALESIEQNGQVVYRHRAEAPVQLKEADRVAFYQLKTMLAGVVERGTAAAARDLAPYVGGKTGTSEDENDTWFAGFTNDVTIVVWVGYDNAEGTRRTLGQGSTGASVALPIFQTIIRAAWANGVPKVALAPPSREARTFIVDVPIDLASGTRLPRGGNHAFVEHFRLDAKGQMVERKTRFVDAEENARLKEARRQRAARRAPTFVMQCFLFFCTTSYSN